LARQYAPIIEVRRAFGVMLEWERTAELTGDLRHHRVAVACCETAIERMRAALATQLSAAERANMQAIEAHAQVETRVEASRQMIAASRALLDEAPPYSMQAAE
jgi:hypothetical protein